jgi:CheY-like chemotaxis protein
MSEGADPVVNEFLAEVRSRFGVLPNFFCTAASAPGLMEELWGFAKSAYLDSPLPSLFKERLFVQLSRFCDIRYCIVRHVGFLVGEGRPAGDASVRPESITQAIALLSRPVPGGKQLDNSLGLLERVASPVAIPEPEAELEGALSGEVLRRALDDLRSTSAAIRSAVLAKGMFELEHRMPRMDGAEAAKRLRTLPDGGQTILIALTGWGQERDRRRTRAAGFDHHLLKPIEPDSLEQLFWPAPADFGLDISYEGEHPGVAD